MLLKSPRRGSTKCLAVVAILLSALVCLYYISLPNQTTLTPTGADKGVPWKWQKRMDVTTEQSLQLSQQCPVNRVMVQRQTDVNTANAYQNFDFQPAWMKTKEYWDDTFERRYNELKEDPTKPPLKVILVPHSHNDPGWLKTFEHYFESETRNILNHLVNKMKQHKNLTFIWSEISFLHSWWDQAHPTKQKAFKKFVHDGRIEITTGGWVMTDEANVHLFAMWNQLVDGHQWLKLNLNITPVTGWSIDPFGHGSTFPYILSNSGFQGTIIQRIHYAWKQWFAWKRYGDFLWIPSWEIENSSGKRKKRDVDDTGRLQRKLMSHEDAPLDDMFLQNKPEIFAEYDYLKNLEQQNLYRLKRNQQANKKHKHKNKKKNVDDDENLMQESVQYNYISENGKLRSDTEVTYEVRLKRDVDSVFQKEDDALVKSLTLNDKTKDDGLKKDYIENKFEDYFQSSEESSGELRVKRAALFDDVKNRKSAMLTHNMPFDIYSIKHSCGPHPYTCLNFDFRKIGGEYTEYSIKAQFINKNNLRKKAELLLEQYSKAGSLFPHNVALVPIGDDFRYNHEVEFDQQYTNYKLLVDFINDNRDRYGTEISFGTPRNYFDEIVKRTADAGNQFPTVAGDFFVYSDIFTEGRPAYWSGYFTTRPYLKILDRTVEHNLRNAEILYTIATNRARLLSYRRNKNAANKEIAEVYSSHLRLLEKHYDSLNRARRHLSLFQHHDAITGTSKHAVMRDYGLKLFEALQIANKVQEDSIESLLVENENKDREDLKDFILRDVEKESYDRLDRKVPISVHRNKRQIVLFNSLPQERSEVIIVRVNDTKISIVDDDNNEIRFQISPVWNTSTTLSKWTISDKEFEVSFIVRLPPLTLSTYTIKTTHHSDPKSFATIYCDKCFGINKFAAENHTQMHKSKFQVKPIQPGDVQLENHDLRLLFDGRSGFLRSVTHKSFLKRKDVSNKYSTKTVMCSVKFAAYASAQFHSGAYLFKPDPNTLDPEKDVLKGLSPGLMIISGLISSELTALYEGFLSHTTRIYNFKANDHPSKNSELMRAVYLETLLDFGDPPRNRETEMFMRLQTNIDNGDAPVMYTDSNSFQYHKRTLTPAIGPEGNYYPITSMAFIQDSRTRLTLITDHAQGAASLEPGYLELMLDRRTLYDDSRGMGEGLIDNKPTVFKNWLVIESIHNKDDDDYKTRHVRASLNVQQDLEVAKDLYDNNDEEYQLPSVAAIRLADALNYPVNIYTVEEPNSSLSNNKTSKDVITISNDRKRVSLISHSLPCDMRLVNLRTLTDETYHQFPWSSALLMLHRQGYSCKVGGTSPGDTCHQTEMHPHTKFNEVKVKQVTETSLTGVKDLGVVQGLGDIKVERMDLAMFRIDFED